MTDDIVARLRLWAEGVKRQRGIVPAVAIREAADEIELLRTERDEARREVCEFEIVNMKQAYEYATHRGWDCYKEEP